MGYLFILDESYLLRHFHDLFRFSNKFFVPRVIFGNMQRRSKIDLEDPFVLNVEITKKSFVRNCQSNHLFPILKEKIEKREWEVIDCDAVWEKRVNSLAELFKDGDVVLYEDQRMVVATLLRMQKIYSEEEIVFFSENRFIKQFAQDIFQDFFSKELCFGEMKDLVSACVKK
ncbi:MAG TPA: hypothetical protein PLQ44_03590 [Candidatus Paceibacterota bacterium]|nr:hypothetical protein [Candidatus Paceibacterota bacterium]